MADKEEKEDDDKRSLAYGFDCDLCYGFGEYIKHAKGCMGVRGGYTCPCPVVACPHCRPGAYEH